jgi:hypothetical protein
MLHCGKVLAQQCKAVTLRQFSVPVRCAGTRSAVPTKKTDDSLVRENPNHPLYKPKRGTMSREFNIPGDGDIQRAGEKVTFGETKFDPMDENDPLWSAEGADRSNKSMTKEARSKDMRQAKSGALWAEGDEYWGPQGVGTMKGSKKEHGDRKT